MQEESARKRVMRKAITYERPIKVQLGAEKTFVIWKDKEDYYLIEPERANTEDLAGSDGTLPIYDGATVVVGRKELTSECFNLPKNISRYHLMIKREQDTFFLFDLHSENGTFILEE